MTKPCVHEPNYDDYAHAATGGQPVEEFGIVWNDMDQGQWEAYMEASRDFHDQQDFVVCSWGWCVTEVCTICHKVTGGYGIAACPHDLMHGWRSPYVEGMPKVHPPIKAKGRHRTRITRSKEVHDAALHRHLVFQGKFKKEE